MSLVNKLLHDLEDRHAFTAMGTGHVLNDLRSAQDYAVESRIRETRLRILLVLLLAAAAAELLLNRDGLQEIAFGWQAQHEPPVLSPIEKKNTAIAPDSATGYADRPGSPLRGARPEAALHLKLDVLPPTAETAAVDRRHGDPAAIAGRISLAGLSHENSTQGAEISLAFTRTPQYRLHILGNPDRLLVELPDTDLPGAVLEKFRPAGLLERMRHGRRGDNARLVFDLAGPVVIEAATVREARGSGHVLDIRLSSLHAAPDEEAADAQWSPELLLPAPLDELDTEIEPLAQPMVKRETQPAKDQDADFSKGVQAYRAADPVSAIERFRSVLTRDPAHLQARQYLVAILMEHGDAGSAKRIASEGMNYHPADPLLIKSYARLLFEANEAKAALDLLLRDPPSMLKDPDYHGLTAAILQQEGRHAESVDMYSRLARLDSERGRWWAGLGISLEALNRPTEALKAYRQAGRDATMPPALKHYLGERILALARSPAQGAAR